MFEINWEEALKLADKMGINYKTNSKTPGFFVKDETGKKIKLTHSDLTGELFEGESSLDDKISKLLNEISITLPDKIRIESKFLYFNDDLDEVA